jgi:hypothetical protein
MSNKNKATSKVEPIAAPVQYATAFTAEELNQFDQLLDGIPHGYSKQIIQFFNVINQRRQEETAQKKSSEVPLPPPPQIPAGDAKA